MAWRLPNKDWVAGKGPRNKRAFKKIVTAGQRPGVLGYLGKQPIAWCAVAPHETYSFLERSRVLQPLDDEPVWSISCLFVLKPYRRKGISVSMLKAALGFAAKRGATIVDRIALGLRLPHRADHGAHSGSVRLDRNSSGI